MVPVLGYGTYKATLENGKEPVLAAIKAGYRYVDTASFYQNEEAVGAALRQSGLPRTAYQVATKVWKTEMGYENALAACDRSLKKLGLDFVDVYLIHWPPGGPFGPPLAGNRAGHVACHGAAEKTGQGARHRGEQFSAPPFAGAKRDGKAGRRPDRVPPRVLAAADGRLLPQTGHFGPGLEPAGKGPGQRSPAAHKPFAAVRRDGAAALFALFIGRGDHAPAPKPPMRPA